MSYLKQKPSASKDDLCYMQICSASSYGASGQSYTAFRRDSNMPPDAAATGLQGTGFRGRETSNTPKEGDTSCVLAEVLQSQAPCFQQLSSAILQQYSKHHVYWSLMLADWCELHPASCPMSAIDPQPWWGCMADARHKAR